MTDRQREHFKHRAAVMSAWIVSGLFFFPIFWLFLTSFKTELQAIAVPPKLVTTELHAESK